MWHHKTKIGTFWIIEAEANDAYFLGFDEESLGKYKKIEDAIHDIVEHETGDLKWDLSSISVPESIEQWQEGEPENWDEA